MQENHTHAKLSALAVFRTVRANSHRVLMCTAFTLYCRRNTQLLVSMSQVANSAPLSENSMRW